LCMKKSGGQRQSRQLRQSLEFDFHKSSCDCRGL
jgi:hypothetical protein